jgi:hypothetical protein
MLSPAVPREGFNRLFREDFSFFPTLAFDREDEEAASLVSPRASRLNVLR